MICVLPYLYLAVIIVYMRYVLQGYITLSGYDTGEINGLFSVILTEFAGPNGLMPEFAAPDFAPRPDRFHRLQRSLK